jgi:signal transduction histidine kinase
MPAIPASIQDQQLIRNNRLFAGIPSDLLSDIGSDMDLIQFDPEDVIFHEGEQGDCLFLVCEGSVRISKAGRGGQQETLGFIQPGNFFGEMALIDGQPRSAQASAAERTVLGRVDHSSFERILALAPGSMHMNFLRSVVERLRSVNSHFISELMRTERISTVGTMANSIIHDLKNPITVIRSCSDLLCQRFNDPAITEFSKLMNRAVDGMTDMIQELLDFARGESSVQLERKRALSVIEELDITVPRLLPDDIHLIKETDCSGMVDVDLGRFARVLLNLIKNAIEAMPKGGILWLGARRQGNRVIYKVGDTGCGIPAELQPKIFEPFITHGKSKGTGLGLAIVKSVVDSHSGTISLHSKEGIGTTFEVSIPAFDEAPAA